MRASKDEENLVTEIFDKQGYNPLIRPVDNASEALNVGLELALIQIIRIVSVIIIKYSWLNTVFYWVLLTVDFYLDSSLPSDAVVLVACMRRDCLL